MKPDNQRTSLSVGLIPGDGIGPTVVGEALRILSVFDLPVHTYQCDLGMSRYLATGEVLPDEELRALATCSAILMGAIGPPVDATDVSPGVLERGIVLAIRSHFDLYINLRPFRGAKSSRADGADFVIIRENTEGPYADNGGSLRPGTNLEVATQGSINTYMGVERCVRYAFELALQRRKHLTLIHKRNVMRYAGALWSRVFDEISGEYPSVATDYHHADAAAMYIADDPRRYDVIVTDNLFGDLLTDLAAAVTGGIGLSASVNVNPSSAAPPLFEPAHGAAHDIAGTGRANPLATIHAAALMLDHLGFAEQYRALLQAVYEVEDEISSDHLQLGTRGIGDRVLEHLSEPLSR